MVGSGDDGELPSNLAAKVACTASTPSNLFTSVIEEVSECHHCWVLHRLVGVSQVDQLETVGVPSIPVDCSFKMLQKRLLMYMYTKEITRRCHNVA